MRSCVCAECVWRIALTAEQMEAPVRSLAPKILVIFGHTDKSNTSFTSVKTLRLFVCTHNKNKSRVCKIMKANNMRFLPSRSVNLSAKLRVYLYLTDIKNIYIESEMSTFKWTNSNGRQIFSDYVIRMKHAYRRITSAEMTSLSLTLSLKPRTKKALVYQVIKILMQPPYCFSLTHS